MGELEDVRRLLEVQQQIITSAFADQDEKRIALADVMNKVLVYVATIAETGKQNMWLNRLLVAGLLVLAGAEKVLGWNGV